MPFFVLSTRLTKTDLTQNPHFASPIFSLFRANDDSGVRIRTSCIKNDLRQARLNFCSHTPRFLSLITEVTPYETRDPKRTPTVCNSPARRWNPGRHGGYAGHRRLTLIRRRTHALDSVDPLQVIYHQRCPRDLLSHSASSAPRYILSGSISASMCLVVTMLALVLRYVHQYENKNLDEAERDAQISMTDQKKKNTGFRYVY